MLYTTHWDSRGKDLGSHPGDTWRYSFLRIKWFLEILQAAIELFPTSRLDYVLSLGQVCGFPKSILLGSESSKLTYFPLIRLIRPAYHTTLVESSFAGYSSRSYPSLDSVSVLLVLPVRLYKIRESEYLTLSHSAIYWEVSWVGVLNLSLHTSPPFQPAIVLVCQSRRSKWSKQRVVEVTHVSVAP